MLLDFGGNIHAIGTKLDGSLWRLGLRGPFLEGTLDTLEISDLAIVTSGTYERYFTGEDGTFAGISSTRPPATLPGAALPR